jgi:hypothetical protein
VRVLPLPPITRGSFVCTGFGSHQASATVNTSPEKLVTVLSSSDRMISIPSSNRSKRSLNVPSSMPYALDSISFQPAPIPRMNRPPEMMSSVAAMFAVTAGWR